jgi:nucleotide-binding universal stress UspA family protein
MGDETKAPLVVAAVDFSEVSPEVVRRAAALAGTRGALHVVHAVRSGPTPSTALALTELVKDLGRPVVASVLVGLPAAEIVAYAERERASLLVVGTHGRTGFTHLLLGSVAERVARTAPCPVLTVPAGRAVTPPVGAGQTLGPLRRCIVCAKAAEDLVCEPCRARIRGEAVRQQMAERATGTGPH